MSTRNSGPNPDGTHPIGESDNNHFEAEFTLGLGKSKHLGAFICQLLANDNDHPIDPIGSLNLALSSLAATFGRHWKFLEVFGCSAEPL